MTSKAEYLKKYLSSESKGERKKKKKKPKGIKIIDDDNDNNDDARVGACPEDEDRYDLEEERPTVVGEVDERPEFVKKMEVFSSSDKWRRVAAESDGKDRRDDSESPPRKRVKGSDSDLDVNHRQTRHDSDSDASVSPPRHFSSQNSPRRRKRNDSDDDDDDLSPPRVKNGRGDDSPKDSSPPRRKTNNVSPRGREDDLSPPRRKQDRDLSPRDDDLSPRRKLDDDLSPRRKQDDDLSPPRRKQDDDMSPPRRKQNDDLSPPRKISHTSRGHKAGLQSAKQMREENERVKRKETAAFDSLDANQSGRNAKTIVREKRNEKMRDLEAKKKEKERIQAERKEIYDKWGKGLIQTQQRNQNVQDAIHEMSKPLTRNEDDEDLDAMLKEREREDDPMLAFINKKKGKGSSKKTVDLPTYKGPFPPNRFNIRPGYRWDGVNRSNGFEKTFYERQADRKANADVAFKWSTEDM